MDAYARVDRDYNRAQDKADQWAELVDGIEQSMTWASESLVNFRYSHEHRLQKAKSYLQEALDTINNELERMDENE